MHILRRRREPEARLLLLKPRLLLLGKARLLRREARLLLRGKPRLAAERGGAAVLRLLRKALLKALLRSIALLLLYKLLLLLGITLLEALLLRLLTKTHGRLLHLGPIQGRRRRRGARIIVRNKFLQPLGVRLPLRTGRV